MSDMDTDSSEVINDIRVYGGALISDDLADAIREHYMADLKLPVDGWRTMPYEPPTRRQRLRRWWRDLRYDVGHRIVGYECEDDW